MEISKKAKALGLQEIDIHMGAFDFTVVAVIGKYEKMTDYIRWKFEDKGFDAAQWERGYAPRGQCFFRRGYVPGIWLPRRPRTPREYATLAHECLHAVYHMADWAGLALTRDTEEVMAHSMAHLINGILKESK